RLDRAHLVEQPEASGGEQSGEFGHIHGTSLRGESVGSVTIKLALALRECQPNAYTWVSTLGLRVRTSLSCQRQERRGRPCRFPSSRSKTASSSSRSRPSRP